MLCTSLGLWAAVPEPEWALLRRCVPLAGEPPAGYPRAMLESGGGLLLTAGDKRLYRLAPDFTSAERLGTLPVRQGGRAVPFGMGGKTFLVANDNLEHPAEGRRRDHAVRLFEWADGAARLVSTIVETGEHGCYEPFPLVLPNGDLLVAYSREYPHANPMYQVCELRRSTDGGLTWQEPTPIAADDRSRDGMPVLCLLPDGRLLAVFECTEAGWFRIACVTSGDGGRTWGRRRLIHDPGPGGYSGAPYVVRLADGLLICSFQTRLWSPEEDLAYVVSSDSGDTWSAPRPILAAPGQQLWGSLLPLTDGRLLALVSDAGGVAALVRRF